VVIVSLKKAIPTLKQLVNTYLQKQTQIYTFSNAVDALEPFCIYYENMNYEISNVIKSLLYTNIDTYIKHNKTQDKLYKNILKLIYWNTFAGIFNLKLNVFYVRMSNSFKCTLEK
jgi:hypothetical protein